MSLNRLEHLEFLPKEQRERAINEALGKAVFIGALGGFVLGFMICLALLSHFMK